MFKTHNESINNFEILLDKLIVITKSIENPLLFEYQRENNIFHIKEIWVNESDFIEHQKSKHLEDFRQARKKYLISIDYIL